MSIENLVRKPSIPVPQFRGIEYSRTQHGPSMAYTSQREFHDARDRFKGFSGPIGSGKSKALCHEALQLAYVNHGCLGVIGAPTYPMLRDATLTAFLEILEDNQVPYQFNKSEYSLVLPEAFFHVHYFGTRTIGVSLFVEAPGFDVRTDLDWERRPLYMIGDHITIRWKPTGSR